MPSAAGVPTVGDDWRLIKEFRATRVGTARLSVGREESKRKWRVYIRRR